MLGNIKCIKCLGYKNQIANAGTDKIKQKKIRNNYRRHWNKYHIKRKTNGRI